MDMEFRDNFEIINSLIDYSENITYNYKKELESNLIKVRLCFFVWILAILYFNVYINYYFVSGIEDID